MTTDNIGLNDTELTHNDFFTDLGCQVLIEVIAGRISERRAFQSLSLMRSIKQGGSKKTIRHKLWNMGIKDFSLDNSITTTKVLDM